MRPNWNIPLLRLRRGSAWQPGWAGHGRRNRQAGGWHGGKSIAAAAAAMARP